MIDFFRQKYGKVKKKVSNVADDFRVGLNQNTLPSKIVKGAGEYLAGGAKRFGTSIGEAAYSPIYARQQKLAGQRALGEQRALENKLRTTTSPIAKQRLQGAMKGYQTDFYNPQRDLGVLNKSNVRILGEAGQTAVDTLGVGALKGLKGLQIAKPTTKLLVNTLGRGVEGAGYGALDALSRGGNKEDIIRSAKMGGAFGGALGFASGAPLKALKYQKIASSMDSPIPSRYSEVQGAKMYKPNVKTAVQDIKDFAVKELGFNPKVNNYQMKGKVTKVLDPDTGKLISWSTDNPNFARNVQEGKLTMGMSTRSVKPSEGADALSNEARTITPRTTPEPSLPQSTEATEKIRIPKQQSKPSEKFSLIGEIKRKLVDSTAPLSDTLSIAEKRGKFNILPKNDIRLQIDRVLRSDSLATQFIKDNKLDEVIRKVDDLDEFNQYLIAKQSRDVSSKGIKTGRDSVADDNLIAALGEKYEPFAQQIYAYNRKLLDTLTESGMISKELNAKLKAEYPNYVPLNRVFSEIEQKNMGFTGRGKGVASQGTQGTVKKLKGSEREIEDPIESIISKTSQAFQEAERNKAAQMLASYKDLPGNPFDITPLRTMEQVRERINLFSEAKELKPLQNRASKLISTFGRQIRRLESAVNKLEQKGYKISLKQKRTGTPDFTTSGLEDLKTRDTRRFVNSLITDPNRDIQKLKKMVATRKNKLAPLFDELQMLKDEYEAIRGVRGNLIDEGRALRDAETRGKSIITAFKDGVKEIYEVDPVIAEAAKNLNQQQIGILGQIIAVPTRILKLGATGVNLPFVASNVVKDQTFAAINSNRALQTSLANPVNFVRSFWTALTGRGKLYDDWVRSGSSFTSFDIARNQVKPTVARIRSGKNVGSRIAYSVTHPQELVRTVEDIIGKSEELTRIQQFNGMKNQLIKEGRTVEDATLLAAKASRENTANFARRGEWGNWLNVLIPYLNAGIQGTRSLVGNMTKRPVQTAAKLSTIVFLPMAYATTWNLSDPKRREAYEDIQEYEKEGNIIIIPPNPTKDENGRWNAIKIPLTPGVSNLANIVRRGVEGVSGLDGNSFTKVASDLFAAGTSFELDRNKLVSQFTPQGLKPIIEGYTNTNLFTGNKIVPEYMKDLPTELQVRDNTSGTARIAGKMLNTSPLKVENAIRTIAGGVGQQALNASDRLLAKAGVIPEDQIGGKGVAESISSRFTSASGGQQLNNLYENKQTSSKSKAEGEYDNPNNYKIVEANDKVYVSFGKNKVKTYETSEEAQKDINKDTFDKSGKKSELKNGIYYYRDKNGDPKSMTEGEYNTKVRKARMDVAYNNKDYKGWIKLAEEELKEIENQYLEADELTQTELLNDYQDLVAKIAKYQGYGGFTKGKKGKRISLNLKAPEMALRSSISLRKPTAPRINLISQKGVSGGTAPTGQPRSLRTKRMA